MGVFKKEESHRPPSYVRTEKVEKNHSLIGKTLYIKGKLSSDEEVIIEGKVEGTIKTKNLVIVGKTGLVNADVDAREIIIKGRLNGNVKVSHKVEIVPEGVLNGNIISKKVILAEGSIFKGNIDMDLDDPIVEKKPPAIKTETKPIEETVKDKK